MLIGAVSQVKPVIGMLLQMGTGMDRDAENQKGKRRKLGQGELHTIRRQQYARSGPLTGRSIPGGAAGQS